MYGPGLAGLFVFLGDVICFRFLILQADWGSRLLDRVIQATSIGAAFWGIAITLLIGMDAKPIVIRLKRVGYYRVVIRYFGESLISCFALLLLSIVMEPLDKLSPSVLSGLWLGAAAWAAATTLRTYLVLAHLLMRVAEGGST
jgi:peptidoglycan biosynthesis protein MviN/MurJ (putative lipid II flippase)